MGMGMDGGGVGVGKVEMQAEQARRRSEVGGVGAWWSAMARA